MVALAIVLSAVVLFSPCWWRGCCAATPTSSRPSTISAWASASPGAHGDRTGDGRSAPTVAGPGGRPIRGGAADHRAAPSGGAQLDLRPDRGRRDTPGRCPGRSRHRWGPSHPAGLPVLGLLDVCRVLAGLPERRPAGPAVPHPAGGGDQGTGAGDPGGGGRPGSARASRWSCPPRPGGTTRFRVHPSSSSSTVSRVGGSAKGWPTSSAKSSSWSGGPSRTPGRSRRAAGAGGHADGLDGPERELDNDRELITAGILPGDPSLYPSSLEAIYGPSGTNPDRTAPRGSGTRSGLRPAGPV